MVKEALIADKVPGTDVISTRLQLQYAEVGIGCQVLTSDDAVLLHKNKIKEAKEIEEARKAKKEAAEKKAAEKKIKEAKAAERRKEEAKMKKIQKAEAEREKKAKKRKMAEERAKKAVERAQAKAQEKKMKDEEKRRKAQEKQKQAEERAQAKKKAAKESKKRAREKRRGTTTTGTGKRQRIKKVQQFCTCKTSGKDGRQMINCSGGYQCPGNGWYHTECLQKAVENFNPSHYKSVDYYCPACTFLQQMGHKS